MVKTRQETTDSSGQILGRLWDGIRTVYLVFLVQQSLVLRDTGDELIIRCD